VRGLEDHLGGVRVAVADHHHAAVAQERPVRAGEGPRTPAVDEDAAPVATDSRHAATDRCLLDAEAVAERQDEGLAGRPDGRLSRPVGEGGYEPRND